MCTVATYKTKDFYFGRTLDYEFSYGDQIVIRKSQPHFPKILSSGSEHRLQDIPFWYAGGLKTVPMKYGNRPP